jgi:hypothetical protein
MLEKTIDSALLALRKRTIREGREGLAQVEALLTLRGVHMPTVLPPKRGDVSLSGHMRWWLLDALSERPMKLAELVEVVRQHQPGVPHERLCARTSNVLWKMKLAGMVRHERRWWIGH